jgi:hypothetical protein
MTRRVVTFILCLPAAGAILHWLLEHPDRSQAPAIAAATFGGFALLVLSFALVLPAAMRRLGEVARAEQWRRAAIVGLPPAVFFTFVWGFLFLPDLRARELIALGVAGVVSVGLASWWERRATTRDRARQRPGA